MLTEFFKNMTVKLHALLKEEFQECFNQRKLTRISILNANGIILKKINASFVVHFCEGKYSFRLFFNTFILFKTKD